MMRQVRLGAVILLGVALACGLSSRALAQISFTESGNGGCFTNPTSGKTDCAIATFSLMTGGSTGNPGNVVSGISASNVTGLQIVIRNTTPSTVSNYVNADLLTGFFWGISGNPALATSNGTVVGSAIASNSKGGNAVLNPSQCKSVAICTGTSLNVGAYWASSFKSGGWSGTSGTFPGSYVVTTSGYGGITLGQGSNIGANDPTLVGGGSSLNFGLAGGAGSTPTLSGNHPAVQDTVTIQLAFASVLSSFNLDSNIIAQDVYFAYGTNPDASTVAMLQRAPEPASLGLLGVGALALGVTRSRTRRRVGC